MEKRTGKSSALFGVLAFVSVGCIVFGAVQLVLTRSYNERVGETETAEAQERAEQIKLLELPEPTTVPSTTTTTVPVRTTQAATTTVAVTTTIATTTTTVALPVPPALDQIPVNESPFGEVRISRFSEYWRRRNDGREFETLTRGDEFDQPEPLHAALTGGLAWQASSVVYTDTQPPTSANDLSLPGGGGTVVIAGHRRGVANNGPFYYLDEMELGDIVEIRVPWGIYTYVITTEPALVHKNDLHGELQAHNNIGKENILLYSCEPGAPQRLFVRGELASVNGQEV